MSRGKNRSPVLYQPTAATRVCNAHTFVSFSRVPPAKGSVLSRARIETSESRNDEGALYIAARYIVANRRCDTKKRIIPFVKHRERDSGIRGAAPRGRQVLVVFWRIAPFSTMRFSPRRYGREDGSSRSVIPLLTLCHMSFRIWRTLRTPFFHLFLYST